jgi:hypothetical protein
MEVYNPSKRCIKKHNTILALVISFIFICAVILHWLPEHSFRPRAYSYFSEQATAILDGHCDLKVPDDFTHDLIIFGGKTYLSLPPLNAFLAIPLAYSFGKTYAEPALSLLFFAAGLLLLLTFMKELAPERSFTDQIILLLFFGLGTDLLICSVIGTSWFNATLSSAVFLTLGWLRFVSAHRTREYSVALFIMALAALGRLHLGLLLPLLGVVAWWTHAKRRFVTLCTLMLPTLLFGPGVAKSDFLAK